MISCSGVVISITNCYIRVYFTLPVKFGVYNRDRLYSSMRARQASRTRWATYATTVHFVILFCDCVLCHHHHHWFIKTADKPQLLYSAQYKNVAHVRRLCIHSNAMQRSAESACTRMANKNVYCKWKLKQWHTTDYVLKLRVIYKLVLHPHCLYNILIRKFFLFLSSDVRWHKMF